ncbi:MAG: tetratricopeptide repeat protein, partial [Pseudomonadota bacterium]
MPSNRNSIPHAKPLSDQQAAAVERVYQVARAAFDRGDIGKAKAKYSEIIRNYPFHIPTLLDLSTLTHDAKAFDKSLSFANMARHFRPENSEAHNFAGLAELGLNQISEAVTSFEKAVQIEPNYLDALNNLGNALKRQKKYAQAENAFDRAIKCEPRFYFAHYNKGLLLQAQQQPERAKTCFEDCLKYKPDWFKAIYQLGQIAESEGNFDEAAKRYRSVIALQPGYIAPLTALLALKSQPVDLKLIDHAKKIAASPAVKAPDSFNICYALGKRFELLKDYDQAFSYLSLANQRRSIGRKYIKQHVEIQFMAYKNTFTPEFLKSRKSIGHYSDRPVFIVGMPRTGTTLLEQILGSHPDVFGAGELPHLPRFINQWQFGQKNDSEGQPPSRTYPSDILSSTDQELSQISKDYL